MLSEYKKQFKKETVQYLTLDGEGLVLESDDVLFPKLSGKSITELNPFFETVVTLLDQPNQEYSFTCIHLGNIIADITLKTFKKNTPALVTITDMTSHYSEYQISVQERNESVIYSEVLELKNDVLKEKEAFKNTFLANFSHELRNPLSGIITFTEFLSNTELDKEQVDYINLISNSSLFLRKMINDILDISKIETGKLDLHNNPFNLKSLLESLELEYKVKAKKQNLDFYFDLDKNVPETVVGDRLRLRQILINLLDNAINYTPSGSVGLKVKLKENRAKRTATVVFEIADTGVGIPKEKFDDIFNSFIKLNNAEGSKGTGLGLSIVKRLVESLQGEIDLKSEPNIGTTFSLTLKFKRKNGKNKVPKSKPKTNGELKKNGTKYNVLLVEDSEITQLSVLKILAQEGNFYLDIANNVRDVIPRLGKDHFDLILMDMNINGELGSELSKKIREQDEEPIKNIPIIALTGSVSLSQTLDYKDYGMNDLLLKPFTKNSLVKKIYEHLK